MAFISIGIPIPEGAQITLDKVTIEGGGVSKQTIDSNSGVGYSTEDVASGFNAELYASGVECGVGTRDDIAFSVYQNNIDRITVKETTGNVVIGNDSFNEVDTIIDKVQIHDGGIRAVGYPIKGHGHYDTDIEVVTNNGLTSLDLNNSISILTGTAGLSFEGVLPAADEDIHGMSRTVMSTATRVVTTWTSVGGSVVAGLSTLTAGIPITFTYNHPDTTWYRTK